MFFTVASDFIQSPLARYLLGIIDIVVDRFKYISRFVSSLAWIRLIPNQLRFTESEKDFLLGLLFYLKLKAGKESFILSRRSVVIKGVEHISTNVLVNIWMARVRVPLVLSVGIWICKYSTINT